MSLSFVVPPFAVPPPGGARRRRRAVLLAATLGALSLVCALIRGTPAYADLGPDSTVLSPAAGTQIGTGSQVTVRGSANNGESGGIVRVELSLDGGQTWHLTQPVQSVEDWSYTFTPTEPGVLTLVSRAATRNLVENPTRSTTLKVSDSTGSMLCPCLLNWPTPGFGVHDEDDTEPVELGLRFTTDRDGYVSGVMFKRYYDNTGQQVVHLWDAYGNLLAEQTLTSTVDAWGGNGYPYIKFDQPVPISRGSIYTASYYTPTGHYASSEYYFSNSYWDYQPPFRTPLHWAPLSEAPEDYAGVYHYGEGGGYPDETWHASNYWVEPVFTTG